MSVLADDGVDVFRELNIWFTRELPGRETDSFKGFSTDQTTILQGG